MQEIVLSSRNKNKIAELGALFSNLPSGKVKLLSLDDVGFYGEIDEDGRTFEENSVIKASALASKGYICIADDTGLSVNAIGGAPGIYSARYGGEHANYAANNEKLLSEMSGKTDRSAKFVCVMSIVIPDESGVSVPCELVDTEMSRFASERAKVPVKAVVLRGECHGSISESYRGQNGFGYDPLFIVDGFGKTFAEMTSDEKNAVSHRGKAVGLLVSAIGKIFAE